MLVSQLLKIGRGAIIELDQRTTDPVEIRVNQELIAYGEIVTVDDKLGVTITEIIKRPSSAKSSRVSFNISRGSRTCSKTWFVVITLK